MSAERSLLGRLLAFARPEPTQHVEFVRHTTEERKELIARAFGREEEVEEPAEEHESAGAPRRLAPRPTV
jgi:hypothetical protein